MKTVTIDTNKSETIKELVEQMKIENIDNLFTENDSGEMVRIELYEENESTVELKAHLRYVVYHDEQVHTEMIFEHNGGLITQSSYTVPLP